MLTCFNSGVTHVACNKAKRNQNQNAITFALILPALDSLILTAGAVLSNGRRKEKRDRKRREAAFPPFAREARDILPFRMVIQLKIVLTRMRDYRVYA